MTEVITPGESKSLTASTFTGIRWTYLATVVQAILLLVYTGSMSRLLNPEDFGLMALAMLAMNAADIVGRMGVAQALVQKPTITQDDVRASVTSGLILGGICALSLFALAPFIAGVYNKPAVTPLLQVLSVHVVVVALGTTSGGLLRRAMRFRELALIQIATSVVTLLVGLGAALAGAGVWSLVAATTVSATAGVVLQYSRARHSLIPIARWRALSSLYSFGARISGLRFMEFLGRQLDTFAVGRYLSAAALGQYNRAFVLVNLPMSQYLTMALTSVLFPGFSRIQSDPVRVKRAYLAVLALAGLVLLPIGAGIGIAAQEIVRVVLGPQWDVAVTLVPWFALAIVLSLMSRFAELTCEALAELNKATALQGTYLVVLAGLLLAVSSGELWMFAAALATGEIVRHLAFQILMSRLLGLHTREYWQVYAPALFTAVVVAAIIYAGQLAATTLDIGALGVLIVEVLLGAVGLLIGIRLNPVRSIKRLLRVRLNAATGSLRLRGLAGMVERLALGRSQ